jgi:hypothetical protein
MGMCRLATQTLQRSLPRLGSLITPISRGFRKRVKRLVEPACSLRSRERLSNGPKGSSRKEFHKPTAAAVQERVSFSSGG